MHILRCWWDLLSELGRSGVDELRELQRWHVLFDGSCVSLHGMSRRQVLQCESEPLREVLGGHLSVDHRRGELHELPNRLHNPVTSVSVFGLLLVQYFE